MNPFSPLALLATDIHHKQLVRAKFKDGFRDTNRPRLTPNNILFRWLICGMKETLEVAKEVR